MYHVKRPREEDNELDWEEGAHKRIRTLPFRTSPTAQHRTLFSATRQVSKPPALMPAESSDEDSEIEFHSPEYLPKPQIPTFVNTDADMDYDMGDAQPMTSPMWSPKTPANSGLLGGGGLASPAYPQLLHVTPPDSDSLCANAARVPTPIYGHFAPLQRTTIANANSPTAADPPPAGVVRTTNEQHDAFLRRRRLPSPICEDVMTESQHLGGSNVRNSIDTILESPLPVDSNNNTNMDSPITMLQGLDMRTTPVSATFPSHSIPVPVSPTYVGRRKSSGESMSSAGSSSGASSLGRRRSDAVSGGESRKFVFSMGFRADCEKCREHVPGHYSHVLRV